MPFNTPVCGYLDVKISAKSRRGLTPWKAWQKQWCELKRLDSIVNGIELKLKSSTDGSVLNCVVLPRSSIICRTESRTKQYAFGVFTLGRTRKPLLFMSGASESDTQEWMSAIRRMLCVATYLPVGESNFHVSIVDNAHSRKAGLMGLYGVLGTSTQQIVIRDPCTGDPLVCWQWYQFYQFHLQASAKSVDDKLIIVMHTSGEFSAGAGQIYLYCKQGPRLLSQLVARGKRTRPSPDLKASKRLSRIEGDLCCSLNNSNQCAFNSPMCIRSQVGSDDSGVRVSISSDDSAYALKPKTASSIISIGMAVLTKTPGGNKTNENSLQDLTLVEELPPKGVLPRRESGISLSSGIYEQIFKDPVSNPSPKTNHIYENSLELILHISSKLENHCKPPLLPPRRLNFTPAVNKKLAAGLYKHRCNTLPVKDLSRISQIFTSESDYVDMSPSKANKKSKVSAITEFFAGAGQIYLYCKQGPRLLSQLVARGKKTQPSPDLKASKKLSRIESDLCCSLNNSNQCASDSPMCIRSQEGNDDSGVRVSISSDDSTYAIRPKSAASLISIGMAVLTKTPEGNETNENSLHDLTLVEELPPKGVLPRRKSGISLSSGIYEEISEDPVSNPSPKTNHIYENSLEVILDFSSKLGNHCKPPPLPPPLPPRRLNFTPAGNKKLAAGLYKHRCNTLPVKDLSIRSQIFTSESDYVDMSLSKAKEKFKISAIEESLYMPMSPVINLKNKIENPYMIMNGKK